MTTLHNKQPLNLSGSHLQSCLAYGSVVKLPQLCIRSHWPGSGELCLLVSRQVEGAPLLLCWNMPFSRNTAGAQEGEVSPLGAPGHCQPSLPARLGFSSPTHSTCCPRLIGSWYWKMGPLQRWVPSRSCCTGRGPWWAFWMEPGSQETEEKEVLAGLCWFSVPGFCYPWRGGYTAPTGQSGAFRPHPP